MNLRKNVAAIICDEQDRFLFCLRRDGKAWQVPQGGVEEGESFEEALFREISEEIGVFSFQVLGKTQVPVHYLWPPEFQRKDDRYLGQEQTFFVIRLNAEEVGQVKPSEEFSEFAWRDSIEEILAETTEFKRDAINNAWAQLRPDFASRKSYSVRQFDEQDWADYREIRLRALASHPESFRPSQDETQFSERDWVDRLAKEQNAIFGLYHLASNEKPKVVGITGIVRDAEDNGISHLVMSYIEPEHRGYGLSRCFYWQRLQWAYWQKEIKELRVHHRSDNLASAAAHKVFAFHHLDSYEIDWPDGSSAPCDTFAWHFHREESP